MTTAMHHRLTPTQQEIRGRHLAFKAKISLNARADTGVSCPSASSRVAALPDIPKKSLPAEPLKEAAAPWFSIVAEIAPASITIKHVLRAVAADFGVTVAEILSPRRHVSIVRPRQIAMYLCKHLTNFTLPALGRHLGYRDHTTVLHGVRKIDRLWHTDDELMARVERLKAQIQDEHNARHLHHTEAPSPTLPAQPDSPSQIVGKTGAAAINPQG